MRRFLVLWLIHGSPVSMLLTFVIITFADAWGRRTSQNLTLRACQNLTFKTHNHQKEGRFFLHHYARGQNDFIGVTTRGKKRRPAWFSGILESSAAGGFTAIGARGKIANQSQHLKHSKQPPNLTLIMIFPTSYARGSKQPLSKTHKQ